MNNFYPASPTDVPKHITRASKTYKRHAWLAMLLLLTFVIIYLSMTAWFAWTAYYLIVNANAAQYQLFNIVGGACSALLSVFMLRAFFFFEHSGEINDMEVTQEKEPALFDFLHQLADEAGAPRPHRVFLSSRVNAAVFYDLTILNLFFPSKKNVEIGLPLINCLNLGELKAVLAHELGHFAQKSMAVGRWSLVVGRWVYVAQQIAAHIISKRDAFDSFLIGLSRTDIRIAWLGWLLRIIVWSIRSAMETLFSFVIMAQRALSREMEFQADRVAVSLTGSDALIHALHKLEAADDSWERALGFMQSELGNKRAVNNLFLVQQRVIEHLRKILDDASYGKEPTLPTKNPEQFRVFKRKLAQPPKMWATHPENTAREENAKEIYIRANIDSRSGWDLFNNPKQLQETATADTIEKYTPKDSSLTIEDCTSHLDAMYNKNVFNPKYRGTYLGRSAVRNYASVHDMYVDNGMPKLHDFDNLYTKETADHIEQLNNLNEERFHLSSIQNGSMKAHGGIARFRGKELQKNTAVRFKN